MKKYLSGHRYDTETAKKLASDSFSNRRDFHWWSEELYRNKSGMYFLHGTGGPASRYAVSTGDNGWDGGEKIIELSPEAARSWAEEHLDADKVDEIFGEGSTSAVTVQIPETLIEKLDSTRKGSSRSDILVQALREYLK